MLRQLDLFGVGVFSVAGAIAGGCKRMDLFGVTVVAMATALGGGTIRDLVLGTLPVFWVTDFTYVLVATAAAVITFVAVRFLPVPVRALAVADAFGLAIFTVVGTQKALNAGAGGFVAIIMGVMTGVAGGIVRDVLCNEVPLVLRREIYATASMAGGAALVGLKALGVGMRAAMCAAVLVTLGARLAAIHWELSLPVFARGGSSLDG